MKRFSLIFTTIILLSCFSARAQFVDSQPGLLQMPNAVMEENGTFMITNNYINKNALPTSGWGYDTFSYGFNLTFWSRLDVSYVCTIFDGKRRPNPTDRDLIMFNQDRHFAGRFQLLKEGEFGIKWMPSVVVGVSDPTTGSSSGGYVDMNVTAGNGYFNRYYVAASKHFNTPWGQVGGHLAYQYNQRADYALNGPCVGINWRPIWVRDILIIDDINLIAEYDSRTFNMGFIASIWDNRFEAMFELQNMKWINFGLRFKVRMK
ncbi:MAG: YjbH domain-containing protein [Bacteroidales bacterium]|nr:YjbH domain-containing protein [Bacteroidales bacterium]